MSWLSKATGIHLGNIGGPVGFALGSLVGMPQVGAAIGQGAGALGQHKSLGRAALEGAGAYGGAKLLGGFGGGGSAAGGAAGDASSGGGGIMGTLSGLGHSVFDYAKGHPSQILAGLQVANAANLGKKSNQYAQNANNMANQSYMERAGLRSQGIDQLMHPQTPDTSGLNRIRSSNPYAGLPLAGAA